MPRRDRRGGIKKSDTRERWGNTRIVTINSPEIDLEWIEAFIKKTRLVPSRSEYIRVAVRNQINRDIKLIDSMKTFIEDEEELDPNKFVRVPGYNGDKPVEIIRRLEY